MATKVETDKRKYLSKEIQSIKINDGAKSL